MGSEVRSVGTVGDRLDDGQANSVPFSGTGAPAEALKRLEQSSSPVLRNDRPGATDRDHDCAPSSQGSRVQRPYQARLRLPEGPWGYVRKHGLQ